RQYIIGYEKFIDKFLNSPSGVTVMKRLAVTTSGLYNLSVGKIKPMLIPFPPEREKALIIQRADNLLGICDQLKTNLTQAQQTQLQLTDTLVEQAL
ncbi:MAG: hypothetical protein ACPGSM_16245, partial [Thiolinea sp.]